MVTTLILAAGFLVLATSSFYKFRMGLMTAIIITIALISTFFLLPLLLKIEERVNAIILIPFFA